MDYLGEVTAKADIIDIGEQSEFMTIGADSIPLRTSRLNVTRIPDDLKPLRHWVTWKPDKVPVNPLTGQNAASDNPETWGSFEQAVDFYKKNKANDCAGIGFMFGQDDPFTGVDLDKCVNPETGEIEPLAKEIIQKLNSYTEISPSGTGVHIIVSGELPPGRRKEGRIEMYCQGRYFTMTGNHLEGTPTTIESREVELKALHARIFGKEKDAGKVEPTPGQPVVLEDKELLEKAAKAANGEKFSKLWRGDSSGHYSRSEADLALCSLLAFWTGKNNVRIDRLFRKSGRMRPKWDEKHYGDGRTYGQGVVQEAISNTQETYMGDGKAMPTPEEEIKEILADLTEDTPKAEMMRRLGTLAPLLARMKPMELAATIYELKDDLKLTDKDIAALEKGIRAAQKDHEAEPQDTVNLAASFEGLVDLVYHDGKVAFLVKEGDKLVIMPEVKRAGAVHLPPPKEQIPWLLPRGPEVLKLYEAQGSEADLYNDLLAYHRGISELPGEGFYDLLVAWDFHTYLLEAVQYSPIICHFAVPERGKSRTGKGMIYVAYRGMHAESLNEAYILRMASHFQASIFFDVMDIWKKAIKRDSEDILLHRFEKGAKVPRVLYPERGAFLDTTYFEIFGPTIIATNEGAHRILDTRAVQVNMPQTGKRFEPGLCSKNWCKSG